MNQFERLEQYAKLQKPPSVKFKDLEAVVNSRITYNLLPVKVRSDFIRMTDSTILTSVTVQLDNKDLQFQEKGRGQQGNGEHVRAHHLDVAAPREYLGRACSG